MIAYLLTYHYISVQRASQLLSDLLGINIIKGTICSIVNCSIVESIATKAEATIYQEIKSEIQWATCVGGGEVGI